MDNLKHIENFDKYKKSEKAISIISSFLDLFLVNGISLNELSPIDATFALRKGLALSYYNKDIFTEGIFKKICRQYIKNKNFNVNDFSEISSLALLIALGAKNADFVKRNMSKTHDFNVYYDNSVIEAETTRPGEKKDYSNRKKQATDIAQFAFSLKRDFDIKVYMADLLSNSSLMKINSSLEKIKVGETLEKDNLWYMCAEIPNRGINEIYKNETDKKMPDWWPNDIITGILFSGMVAGPESKKPPPQAQVTFGCPFTGYENSAKKKATNFQGTRKLPYLLVIDANELANPYVEFRKIFKNYFPKWPHISGAIIHTDNCLINDTVGWEFEVFINENATRPFKKDVIASIGKFSTRMAVDKKYI